MANKTPLLRPLRKTGSTLYVFPSASEDIGLNINSGTQGVAMSHYALLNFTKNNFKYTDTEEIVKSLQNYVMNFETVVMNQKSYNFQEPYTVSEHIFWHWLISKGLELDIDNPVTSNVYRETKCNSGLTKDRLVQCFGSIDAGNSLSTEFGMFNETYVVIPTSYGNGPVFFRSVNDNPNYQIGSQYRPSNISYLEGRDGTMGGYIDMTPVYDQPGYYTDFYAMEIVKDFPTIQNGLRNLTDNTDIKNSININSFDDLNVDADNVLHNLESGAYDMVNKNCEFDFNAILLYYSVYDLDDVNKEPVATNLFGIVFLDGGQNQTDEYLMSPLRKKKSYSGNGHTNAYFGNSYSFRVNIKTLSVYDNTDAVIQDNTTTTSNYSQDFNDVVYNLNRAIDIMNTNVETTSRIQNDYMQMLDYYMEVKQKVDDMKSDVENTVSNYVNNAIATLDSEVNKKIDEAVEALNGVRNQYKIESLSNVDIFAASDVNVLSHDIHCTLSSLLETHPGGLKISEYVSIIDELKSDVETLKEQSEFLSSGSAKTYNVYGSSNNDMTEDFNKFVETLGIIVCESILSNKENPEQPGYYLKKNGSGKINTIIHYNGTEIDSTEKCTYGKMYSVNSLLYVWNGKTVKLLGSNETPEETK